MENLNLIEDEEKSLIGVLYNHISFGSTLEMFGELDVNGTKRIDSFRTILGKLLIKYNLSNNLPEETYILLGMNDFIKKESLDKFAENEDNKHIQNRAKYLLKKYYEK